MKMKSFAMLIMSGVFFASGAYIAPAMADDANSGDAMMSLADNDMQNGNTNVGNDSSSQNDNTLSSNNSSNPTNDAGGPDTATGDDDY